jgi:hypothetical protein
VVAAVRRGGGVRSHLGNHGPSWFLIHLDRLQIRVR